MFPVQLIPTWFGIWSPAGPELQTDSDFNFPILTRLHPNAVTHKIYSHKIVPHKNSRLMWWEDCRNQIEIITSICTKHKHNWARDVMRKASTHLRWKQLRKDPGKRLKCVHPKAILWVILPNSKFQIPVGQCVSRIHVTKPPHSQLPTCVAVWQWWVFSRLLPLPTLILQSNLDNATLVNWTPWYCHLKVWNRFS